MTRKGILLTVTAAFVICAAPAAAHEGDSATQTDWSGGDGVTGPVTDWSDTFDSSVDISWLAIPGQFCLSSIPLTTPTGYNVDDDFDGTYCVRAADVNGDGDTDVLGAAWTDNDIIWWENDNGIGTSWIERTVDADFGGPFSVHAADVNGDDDIDILSASSTDNDIVWWENDDGSGTSWTEHAVDEDVGGPSCVYTADIDGDTDMDVLSMDRFADDVIWWENDNGLGTSWTEHPVDEDFGGPWTVYAANIDGDTDIDVLSAGLSADEITWWENANGIGTSWVEHNIAGNFDSARSVYAADIDGDTDTDVLGAAYEDDDITWWENDDGSGTSWTEHIIDGDFDGAFSAVAADLDGDNDPDVLGAPRNSDVVTWWENTDGSGTSWTPHTFGGVYNASNSVYAADVNGDGSLDALGSHWDAKSINWWDLSEFKSSGDLTSSIYDTEVDTGTMDLEWGPISWTDDVPTDTTLTVEVRASNDDGDMGSWVTVTSSGDDLTDYVDDDTRYFQYKVSLATTDTSASPTFEDITINWEWDYPDTDIAVTSFSAGSAAEGVEVSWECADNVSGFNLYRSSGAAGGGKAITSRDKLNAELITGESPYAYLDAAVEEGTTYSYWLEAIDLSGSSETFGPVECIWNGALPTAYALYQSRPNPANGTAIIAFDLPEDAKVTLTVYDISGRKVTTLVDETLAVGTYERTVAGLAPGVYVYKLSAGSFNAARKMVIQ